MFGVLDHNTINGIPNNYLQLVEFAHANYLGVGSYGDNSWHLSESYGSANFLFFENNLFNTRAAAKMKAAPVVRQIRAAVASSFDSTSLPTWTTTTSPWAGTEQNQMVAPAAQELLSFIAIHGRYLVELLSWLEHGVGPGWLGATPLAAPVVPIYFFYPEHL